ncbi:receptor-like protein 13 isoform X2 [Tripterygium wilfordii]|uniref:receptor-like protein 13 isoform X2 n=1 Tax=Tripterygium wilfordii TaxID=458696 RepID=UPI0018F858B5|nr:receptor-like protein 13 isoform X2 [Tripterygium wilfordii]
MGPKCICIMVIMWLSMDGGWCHGCWEQERHALLQLKPFFNQLNWVEGDETSDCCKWEGVECSPATGRVITLFLGGSRGLYLPVLYINTSLFLPFEELKELNLASNNIVGCIEHEGFERLSTLSNLEVLDLGFNDFDNNVISSLRGLSSLNILYLDDNQLKGTIDSHEFDSLNNLEELDMSGNKIESFGSLRGKRTLSKLKVLDLGSQQINTNIQLQSLGSIPNLRRLDLRNNYLNGTTTTQELGNLSALEEFFLDDSLIPTDFLQRIGSLTSLKVLSLNGCGLKGILPTQGWCELKNLQGLYLNSNELEGTLPPCLGNLSSLQEMDIYSNQFNGNITSTPIPNLISLQSLWLERNHIEVPMSLKPLANLSNLKHFQAGNIVLDLESQFWTPRFQLESLSLGSSLFKKSKPHLPNFLYYQNDLKSIDLSGCEFGGAFPTWLLENNTLLHLINLRGNYFTGPLLLPSHSNLELSRIDISDNQDLVRWSH